MNRHRRFLLCAFLCLLLLPAVSCGHSTPVTTDTGNAVTPSEESLSDLPAAPDAGTDTPVGTEVPVSTAPQVPGTSAEQTNRPAVTAKNPESAAAATTEAGPSGTSAPQPPVTSVPISSEMPGTAEPPVTSWTPGSSAESGTDPSPVTTHEPGTSAAPHTNSPAPETTRTPGTLPIPETSGAPISSDTPESALTPEGTTGPESTVASSPETTVPHVPVTSVPEETGAPLPDFSNPEAYESDFAYTQLSAFPHGSEMQQFYRSIADGALDFHKNNRNATDSLQYGKETLQHSLASAGVENSTDYLAAFEVPIPFRLSGNELYLTCYAFLMDHPLYYWISSMTFYYSVGTRTQLVIVCDAEYAQGSVRAALNGIICAESEAWYRSVSEVSAYAAALNAHDRICAEIDYLFDSNHNPDSSKTAHSVEGYFRRTGGVCECYAKTFQLWMNLRRIPCIPVTNISHMWNLLQLDDGNWYWVDVTFDDYPNLYAYFCKNDTEDIWTDSGYLPPSNASDRTFLGAEDHTLLPAGGPNFVYKGNTYADYGIYLVPALPERAAAPYSGPGK